VRVSSPQGRFATGAARLDGQVLQRVEAYGKHLLYRWEGGDILHVHLGLVGTFTTHRGDVPPPSAACRLRLARDGVAADLTGPMVCELLDAAAEADVLRELGPDPLRRGSASEPFLTALARRRVAIGSALLDQRVVAGVGNAYRAEALFVLGIAPTRPASDLDAEEATMLWATLRDMLRDGFRRGRIVTTGKHGPPDVARWVYRRAGLPCHRCGTPIASWTLGGRPVYACPTCQPP
jgi:endonuclease VIII